LSSRALIPLALAAASALALPAHAARPMETTTMSDTSTPSVADSFAAAIAEYDETRSPEKLQEAADQIVREEGAVPPDQAAAFALGREELRDWLEVFARIKRDLDPGFDPNQAPSLTVAPPKIGNAQYPPGIRPESLPDPAARKAYQDAIEQNTKRVERFRTMYKLSAARDSLVERAVASLRNARTSLGLPAAEITKALNEADIRPEDRSALGAAAQ